MRRICIRCGKKEPKVWFYKDFGKHGGASRWCSSCRRKVGRSYYKRKIKPALKKARELREKEKRKLKRKCRSCGLSEPDIKFGSDYGKHGGCSTLCILCKRELSKDYYWKNKDDINIKQKQYREGHGGELRKLLREYYKRNKYKWVEWRENNKERWKLTQVAYRQRLKRQVIEAYGGKCSCCGEDEIDFLTLEHIYHDGRAHRENVWSIYRDLRSREWPKIGLTVLCWNCQMATRYRKPCPHKHRRSESDRYGRLKRRVMVAYGDRCACCHEDELWFLTIEHINHDGRRHRELVSNVYRDLRDRGWPKNGFTILCWNCQMATRYRKPCPHEVKKNEYRSRA
jgi:hypothetical protein